MNPSCSMQCKERYISMIAKSGVELPADSFARIDPDAKLLSVLWRRALAQAFRDAISAPTTKYKNSYQNRFVRNFAREYLLGIPEHIQRDRLAGDIDLETLCDFADVGLEAVVERWQAILNMELGHEADAIAYTKQIIKALERDWSLPNLPSKEYWNERRAA